MLRSLLNKSPAELKSTTLRDALHEARRARSDVINLVEMDDLKTSATLFREAEEILQQIEEIEAKQRVLGNATQLLQSAIDHAQSLTTPTESHVQELRSATESARADGVALALIEKAQKALADLKSRLRLKREEAERMAEPPPPADWQQQIADIERNVQVRQSNPFGHKEWAWEYLLRRVYQEFPPKDGSGEYKLAAMQSTPHMSKQMLAILRRFNVTYHPDKNSNYGEEWHQLATRVIQLGNTLLDHYKAKVAATMRPGAGMD